MKIQVIISTMNQVDHCLLERMNIQSDAVVINQCNSDSAEVFFYHQFKIIWINTTTRGVGKSRNMGILYSSAEVILFADDDVVYHDGYQKSVMSFFSGNPKCSLAVFNLESLNPNRPEYIDRKNKSITRINCLRYGACRIAVKREELLKRNVWFSLLFGGGAEYQAGEDNLFITKCIQSGMKCKACKEFLGAVKQDESTWFVGYNEKYYSDRGALFRAMYGRKAALILFLFEIKEIIAHKKSDISFFDICRLGYRGIKKYTRN